MHFYFAVDRCCLGEILLAQSTRGVSAILLGDQAGPLIQQLQDQFPDAELRRGGADFVPTMAQVIRFVDSPAIGLELPLDIRGTPFQQRVWQVLRTIPVGQTLSYREIARRIGAPKAVRAVAGACAANCLAVAIPCHRVIRQDGSLSGYRWGGERKQALLTREKTTQ